ncbi:hypothetical protein ACI784_09405 [Geodermatophilus sp. SYSU D01186]
MNWMLVGHSCALRLSRGVRVKCSGGMLAQTTGWGGSTMNLSFDEFDEETLADIVRYFNYAAGFLASADSGITPDYAVEDAVHHRVQEMAHSNSFMWNIEQLENVHGFGQDQLRQAASAITDRIDRKLLLQLAPVVSASNQCDAVVDGPDCLRVVLEEVAVAEHYVNVQMMLFFSDDAGWRVAGHSPREPRPG